MPKSFYKVYVHVDGRMHIDQIVRNWSDEDLLALQEYDESAWERLQEVVTDQIGYWIQDGTLMVEVEPVDS